MADAAEILRRNGAAVEQRLNDALAACADAPPRLLEAIGYSLLGGGKRMRPALVIESWRACACAADDAPACDAALAAAAAVELVHTFSLVHDDLPAMDNDDLRRGRPTSHKVFGEAMAILAGDALLTLAFETISGTKGAPAETLVDVTRRVASATGVGGMIVGQVVDMISEGKQVDAETMRFMHRNKTGALIEVSCTTGAMLGGGTPEQVSALSDYGTKVGLAFQIADDILDIEGDQAKLGKPVGSDLERKKSTYPALFGLEESKSLARQTVDEALSAISAFDEKADPLREIARFIIEREA